VYELLVAAAPHTFRFGAYASLTRPAQMAEMRLVLFVLVVVVVTNTVSGSVVVVVPHLSRVRFARAYFALLSVQFVGVRRAPVLVA